MTESVGIGDWARCTTRTRWRSWTRSASTRPSPSSWTRRMGLDFSAGWRKRNSARVTHQRYEGRHADHRGRRYCIDVRDWSWSPQVLTWGADHLRDRLPCGGRFLAWDKTGGFNIKDTFSDVEFAWHSEGRSTRRIVSLWKGVRTDGRGGDGNGQRHHPMQKPIRVMEWCIEQCRLEPGALILDPYMGSGTTAIAAFKRKMKFVGVEIDRRWFDVAVERINRQTGDGPLFSEPELPKAEQQSLLTRTPMMPLPQHEQNHRRPPGRRELPRVLRRDVRQVGRRLPAV